MVNREARVTLIEPIFHHLNNLFYIFLKKKTEKNLLFLYLILFSWLNNIIDQNKMNNYILCKQEKDQNSPIMCHGIEHILAQKQNNRQHKFPIGK